MEKAKKASTHSIKNRQVNEPGRYYDGQKGWLPIAGYRRDGMKKQQRKGSHS